MKESEATTKWCPMVRYSKHVDGEIGANRSITHDIGAYCIGSDCMMWDSWEQTIEHTGQRPNLNQDWVAKANNPLGQVWVRTINKGCGDCGLKGHIAEISQ